MIDTDTTYVCPPVEGHVTLSKSWSSVTSHGLSGIREDRGVESEPRSYVVDSELNSFTFVSSLETIMRFILMSDIRNLVSFISV